MSHHLVSAHPGWPAARDSQEDLISHLAMTEKTWIPRPAGKFTAKAFLPCDFPACCELLCLQNGAWSLAGRLFYERKLSTCCVPDLCEPETREEVGWGASDSVGAGDLGPYVFLPSQVLPNSGRGIWGREVSR